MKVNIVLSHTFGPRQELHILRLEFYVRQQNQSTQFSDFKAKIVNVNLRILILKTKNQGHRSISQWWSLFSLKLKRKIRMRIIIISSFSKWESIYLLYKKFDIVLSYRVQLKLIILSSWQHILIPGICLMNDVLTAHLHHVQLKWNSQRFTWFSIKIRCVNDTKRQKTYLSLNMWLLKCNSAYIDKFL